MYRLKEAGIIAYNTFFSNMSPFGYRFDPICLGIWKHDTYPTSFNLTVDNFEINYFNTDNMVRLLGSKHHNYIVSAELSGSQYCGPTINWNYHVVYVEISMPRYIENSFTDSSTALSKPQYSPHKYTCPTYGQKFQYTLPPHTLLVLDKKGTKRIQSISSTFF